MITKESFYECLLNEEVAIKCENKEQWRHVYDTIVMAYPHLSNDDVFDYKSRFPWVCKWCGTLASWTGEGTAHTRRYTYEEFVMIVNQEIVPEDDIEGVGDLL